MGFSSGVLREGPRISRPGSTLSLVNAEGLELLFDFTGFYPIGDDLETCVICTIFFAVLDPASAELSHNVFKRLGISRRDGHRHEDCDGGGWVSCHGSASFSLMMATNLVDDPRSMKTWSG